MDSCNFAHTVADLLQRSYENFAGRPALVLADGAELTYGELGDTAARIAGGLAELGLVPGDRLVLAQRNGPDYAMLDHAMLWGGYVRVAVSFRLHANEIAAIAADADAKVVVVDNDRRAEVERALREAGVAPLVVGATGDREGLTVPGLASGPAISAHTWELDDLAWMPYTSGTTGKPKGVMHTQRSIMAAMRNMLAEFPSSPPQDTVLLVAPLSHLAGWLRLCYSIRGARQVFMPDFDAHEALSLIERYGVTVVPVVPTIVNFMTEQLETGDYDTSSLDTIIYAGSPMAPDRLARAIAAFGPKFMQCYGLTELPMPLTVLYKSDHVLSGGTVPPQLASAGRVTPFIEVRITDADGNEVPAGEIGEIQVRSDNVMRGYWQLPAESDAFVLDGGWTGTGDVGRLDNGYLYIVDRKRDLIVSGGFNVFPSEVEAAVAAVPGVQEVAVVGVPDPKWGETVLAVVVAEPGSTVTGTDVMDGCRAAIAGYKLPRRVEFVEELPKTSSGKLMRRDLRRAYWAASDRNVG
ncbi:class I adenylate-forming enzyme family protein [Nocardia nova]|uniref:class I adenylate-forming enzyme family protein n=1 Tax=Nocardia nova TaxID=37330 RepID=UPI0033D3D825